MENINQIKLNIWGIRGGFRSFCHSEDLNVEEPEIKNTWKDIRDFVYVSDLSVRFFALEFTPTYKVYTLYRPVNDTSRTGAYVAVTLYIPHGLKVTHLVDLLRQISDAYHKDHYDAFGNPNSNPDYVQIYTDIINVHAAHVEKESKKRVWSASTQDNTPKIFPYNDINVLEIFFSEPYRREFLACQEVMFWDSNLIRDHQAYGIKFQKADSLNQESCFQLNGEGIKEQFKGGQIKNQPSGCDIVNFKCNGVDITGSWASSFFEDHDDIEVTLGRPFFDPKVYRGTMIGVGSFFVKRGAVDYEFGLVNLNPRRYSTEIIAPAELASKGFDLYVDNNPVSIDGARGVLNFYGSELDAVKTFRLRYGNASFLVMEKRLRELFTSGNDAKIDPIRVDNLKLIKFEFDHPCKGRLFIDRQELGVDTGNGLYCDYVLPANMKTDVSTFTFDVEDTKVKVEAKDATTFRASLTSSVIYIGIEGWERFQSFVTYNYFRFKVNGKTYSALNGFKFKLPQEVKEAVKKKEGVLGMMVDEGQIIVPCEYEIAPSNGVCVFVVNPKLALFHNETDEVVTLKTDKSKPINITARKRVLLPLLPWDVKAGNGDKNAYEIKEETFGGLQQVVVRRKVNQVVGKAEKTVRRDAPCYYFEDERQAFPLNSTPLKYEDCLCYTIKDLMPKRNVKLCFHLDKTPFPERTARVRENKENGFEVSLNDYGLYVVRDMQKKAGKAGGKPVNPISPADGSGKKGKGAIIGVLAVLVLAIVGLLIWKPWGGGKKPDYVIKIQMNHGTMIEAVDLNPKTDLAQLKLLPKKDSVAYIDLFNDWKKLNFTVITVGEGNSEKIELKEQVKGKKPSPQLVDPKSIKPIFINDTMVVTLTSPAWARLDKIQTDYSAQCLELAQEYTSSSFKKACLEKAYKNVIDKNDMDILKEFVDCFAGFNVKEAKGKVQEVQDKLGELQQKAEDAANAAEEKQNNLNDFKTKLQTVYSDKCTKKAVGELREAYDKVKDYDRSDLDKKMREAKLSPLDDAAFETFLKKQEEFFTIFDEDYSKAQSMVISYTSTFKSKFTADQKNYMESLVENKDIFNWFVDHKTECTNGQYYIFIKEKITDVREFFRRYETGFSTESTTKVFAVKKSKSI